MRKMPLQPEDGFGCLPLDRDITPCHGKLYKLMLRVKNWFVLVFFLFSFVGEVARAEGWAMSDIGAHDVKLTKNQFKS